MYYEKIANIKAKLFLHISNRGLLVCLVKRLLKKIDGLKVEHSLDNFKNNSDIIIANRYDEELADEIDKVYTRNIYTRD